MALADFTGSEMALQSSQKQRWPKHNSQGQRYPCHGDRDGPGIAQEVTPAKLTRIKVVLKKPTGTEVASTLLMGTEWPGQAF